jgi:hypothetical protein
MEENVSPKFEAWKKEACRLPEPVCEFEKWLFSNVAGVLFAEKSGELLMLGAGKSELSIDERIQRIAALSRSWLVSYHVLCRCHVSAKVIIYDSVNVQETLSMLPRWVFDTMDYPNDIGAAEFLEEVGKRWRETGQIPHEIGLALGYPIKDVLGFMGLAPLPCTGRCGWRIYGDPGFSLRKSQEFKQARERAEAFLHG